MGLVRLLFWIALIAAAVWLWRRYTRPRAPRGATPHPDAQPMVRCVHCQTHVPQSQALQDGNRWYCSQAHLEQDRTAP